MNVDDVWAVAASIVVSVGGAGAIIVALSGWLGKVWAERILEKDRAHYQSEIERLRSSLEATNRAFQGEVDKTVHVHRVHFETEFAAIQRVWGAVAKTRRDMSSLRPMFSIGPARQSDEEKLAQLKVRFSRFVDSYDAALNCVDDNRPFITEELHSALWTALRAARAEHLDIQMHGADPDRDWFENGEKNREAFENALNAIAQLIRDRLRALSIRED